MGWAEIPFGDDLKADLFYPADKPAGKWPVVIWLHPYSYQNGWSIASPWESTGSDYRLEQRPSIPAFVKRGFAVLAFDQIGFGARVRDARDFYSRYPKWSLMGKDGGRHARGDRCARRARRGGRVADFADGIFARREGGAPDDGARFARARARLGVRVRSAPAGHRRPRRRRDPALLAPARADAAARVLRRERSAAAVRFRRGAGAGRTAPGAARSRPLTTDTRVSPTCAPRFDLCPA